MSEEILKIVAEEGSIAFCPKCGAYEIKCEVCARLREEKEKAENELTKYQDKDWVPREYYEDAISGLCPNHGGSAIPDFGIGPRTCSKCLRERAEKAESRVRQLEEAGGLHRRTVE